MLVFVQRTVKSGPAKVPSRSAGSATPGRGRGGSTPMVITESTHICGYPECGKRFTQKRALLHHQTKFHGREPVRRRTPAKGSESARNDITDDC